MFEWMGVVLAHRITFWLALLSLIQLVPIQNTDKVFRDVTDDVHLVLEKLNSSGQGGGLLWLLSELNITIDQLNSGDPATLKRIDELLKNSSFA